MLPSNDPVTQPQQNPGQFMGGNGNGTALLQLLRLHAMSGQGPGQTANSGSPQGIQMSQPPQGVGGLPQTQPIQQDVQSMPGGATTSPNAPQPLGQGQPVQTPTTPDDNLQLALTALGNYIKGHTDVLRAKHGVDLQKARASQIAAQGQSQGGQ